MPVTAKNLQRAARLAWFNRPLFLRKFRARINSLRAIPTTPVRKSIKGVSFEFGCDPAGWLMYNGGYEPECVQALSDLLRPGDTFIDVGANVGYMSMIAMGLVGKSGRVISFEPVPQYSTRLRKLAEQNQSYPLMVEQCALGEDEGIARIDVCLGSNIGWNTMVPTFMSREMLKETIQVNVRRLDSYITEHHLQGIALIKIDTEGFEFPVLKGLRDYFEQGSHRPPILCEIAPAAYPLLGCDLGQVRALMSRYDYLAFSLLDHTELDITSLHTTTNVLFRRAPARRP